MGGLREQDADPGAVQGAAGSGVRCPRCTGGGRRAAGAEPAANTSWRRGGELRIAVWGARRPQARKSHPAGAEVELR